ncbi:MAG: histidine kinase [Saprospirales bacterium]|nr:histidine kinase [Saprospirales bacterium]
MGNIKGILLSFFLSGKTALYQAFAAFTVLLSAWPALLFAQPYNFIAYSLSDGLPQSQVFALCHDSQGYLWLGTQGGGLSRFDGEHFTTLTTADGLPSNYVNALLEDREKRLWAGTQQGLVRFENPGATPIDFDDAGAAIEVYALALVQENLLWIGTNKGLFACAANAKTARRIPLPGLRRPPAVTSIFPSETGAWVGTDQGAWLIGTQTLRLSVREGLPGNMVYAFARDAQKHVWMATLGGIAVLDEKTTRVLRTFSQAELQRPACLNAGPDGRMWAGTAANGLLCYHPADSNWTQWQEKDGLPHQNVRCLLRDYAGQLWLGSSGGGLVRVSQQPFRHFDQSRGLAGNRVYALHEDRQGRLWLAVSQNGLQVLDSSGFHAFERDSGFLRIKCKTIAEDPSGNIWVGTEGKGIAVLDSARLFRLNQQNGLPGESVQKIVAGPAGEMWAALSPGGIARVRHTAEAGFTVQVYGLSQGLPDLNVQTLLADPAGNIWFATHSGAVGYLKSGVVAAVYDHDNGLPGAPVRTLAMDRRGRIWAGAKGAGIFWADPAVKKPAFQPLPATLALQSRNIYLLAFDTLGNLWAGTETGVDKISFSPEGSVHTVQHYGKNEGFLGIETCHDAVLEDRNGRIWFGTMNGLMQYLPLPVEQPAAPPRIHFEHIALFYKPLAETAYAGYVLPGGGLSAGLELPYHQNHLSFAFKAVDLYNPGGLLYRWQLEGAENEWSPLSANTQVNYAKLAPGAYTFRVQACAGGQVCSDPIAVSFVIRKPLWQLWWFHLVASVLALALVVWSAWTWMRRIRRSEQRRREQLEVAHRLLQLEQKALQLQMNPHFIFNALTSIQALITEQNYPTARREINQFAQAHAQHTGQFAPANHQPSGRNQYPGAIPAHRAVLSPTKI